MVRFLEQKGLSSCACEEAIISLHAATNGLRFRFMPAET